LDWFVSGAVVVAFAGIVGTGVAVGGVVDAFFFVGTDYVCYGCFTSFSKKNRKV